MASATNSRVDHRGQPVPLETFEQRLCALGRAEIPLLVVRIPELERTAWRRGRRAARSLERRASAAFARIASAVLRGDDLLAHDDGSDIFVAALAAPTRDGGTVDARSALARIAAALESTARLTVATGWTTFDPRADRIARGEVVERALQRGAQERERYAFFSALGHELRTPLASIRGYLETLLDDERVAPATRRRFVRIAYDESLRMSRLIEGMFEISLLDLHATFAPAARGSLAAAFEAVRTACMRSAAAREVRLIVAAAEDIEVALDVDRLTLVVVNVVDNAIKHGRGGGCVRVAVEPAGHRRVRIVVDDDGEGVQPQDRERVFALGERGATASPGTGIGLALVRLMLERAGGRIVVATSPLGGARFILTVPRA